MFTHAVEDAFVVFDAQDSGCLSYGVEHGDQRWFVKRAVRADARASLARAACLHARVRHPAIVRPVRVLDGSDGTTLIYPWRDGQVLNSSTVHGSDRSGLITFQQLPVADVLTALDVILDAHLAIEATNYVAVDLYDGCFLNDFQARRMHLIDLDEYRPGPFVLDSDRLPGSDRYMAPEEFCRGSVIDTRTSVHALGRTLLHLLSSAHSWRGTQAQHEVVTRATAADPAGRFQSVDALVAAWRAA